MRTWKYKDKSIYIVLGILTVFFCWLFCGRYGVFGSKVDWISQHSVLPDYFRKQFYDTGQFFPEFAANIGGGQNIYNFSYYGLLSPVILFSYLLPFVDMGDYMMAASVLSLAVSVILFCRWLMHRGFSRKISFFASLLFLLAGPMIFHSYSQIMFVNYMPFLCMALIGVDRHFEKEKSGFYTVSVFLMIMTSFYFSIGGILVLVLYGMHRYFQIHDNIEYQFKLFSFLADGVRFVMPILTAVLVSGVLLIPTAMALMGTRNTKPKVDWLSLFIPDVQVFRFVYTPYGIGLTTLIITVLLTGLTYKKCHERVLQWGCVIVLTIPIFAYLLNGGLYVRDKVMIPFLPLLCYMIAYYLEKQKRGEIRFAAGFAPFLLTLVVLYVGRKQPNYNKYWKLVMLEGIIMAVCSLIFYWKRYAHILIVLPVLFLFLYGIVYHDKAGQFMDREFYEKVRDKNVGKTIEVVLKEEMGFYRTEQMGSYSENAADLNRIWDMGQYVSSIYSSSYNDDYQAFRNDTFLAEQPFRNILMQSGAKNPLYQRFMGVKYIVSKQEVPGYELYKEMGDIRIYKNDDVAPIAYTTNRVLSEDTYEELGFPYNQMTLLDYAVVGGGAGETKLDESVSKKIIPLDIAIAEQSEPGAMIMKGGNGYHIQAKRNQTVKMDLPEYGDADIFFLQFKVKNNKPTRDVSIWLEGVKNKLTSRGHIYFNNNTTFTYAVRLEERQTEVDVEFGKGDYEITDIKSYAGVLEERQTDLYQAEFQVHKEETKGNKIVGDINADNDGYFITTIPFDSGFEVKVDGKKVKCEKVNTAFLGTKIDKGNHEVEITYHAPGVKVGKIISLVGVILFVILQFKRKNTVLNVESYSLTNAEE